MSEPFNVDNNRKMYASATGILVRAWDREREEWGSYDIAELDTESLKRWLRSRGGENQWAENVVLVLLDHQVT